MPATRTDPPTPARTPVDEARYLLLRAMMLIHRENWSRRKSDPTWTPPESHTRLFLDIDEWIGDQ